MRPLLFAALCAALAIPALNGAIAQSDQLPRASEPSQTAESENKEPSAEKSKPDPAERLEQPDDAEIHSSQAPETKDDSETQTPERVIIAAQDLRSFEGLGLYTRSTSETLGEEFWKGAKRSDLVSLYKALPATSEIPAVQNLIRRSLLTRADASGIQNDIEIESGADLLTLRLEKLLEAGFYMEARAVFGELNDAPYDDRLARAGLMAILFSGEKALACVDANTFKDGFSSESFTHVLTAYCETSTLPDPSPEALARIQDSPYDLLKTFKGGNSEKIPYPSEAFSNLSLFEQAVVVAEKRLDLSGLNIKEIKTAPPSHLPFLIDSKLASDNIQFHLLLRAIEWGYQYQQSLETFYMNALPTAGGTAPKVQPGSAVEAIALLYSEAKNAGSDEDSWRAIESALASTRELGPAAMVPFVNAIADIKPPEGLPPSQLVRIYDIFLQAREPIPAPWAQYQLEANQIKAEPKFALQMMLVSYFLSPDAEQKQAKAEQIYSTINIKNDKDLFFLDNLIENIDSALSNIHNPKTIYEKELNLTFRQDYVMPSMRIWNRLLEAGENRNVTETALLSTVMLKDQSAQTLYPGLLFGILSSLKNVGLTDISNDLAIYASLRNIQSI